ncbi:TonB-dependent receptor [Flavobacterium humi]|uniref:TonB-dependent receptor n=1 Tax=Flavobacterium humi TaxID=2562683 RepID=A0A4Z0L422_9FLAO|nr:TonB-dependent receptor [Flavobacterium humi]TGD56689.1 TonB-dependent receptor [Flavobacterium humi]
MTAKKLLLLCFLWLCPCVLAQHTAIGQLEEVVVSDTQLRDFTISQTLLKLQDSVIRRNAHSLTALLEYTTGIYMKEHGLGMVSSPSFRGTTSSQTAVIWNGININSQLLGQTDFNTVSARSFNSIAIKAGGGSVVYGSGAIGGTIHLNNDLKFTKSFNNDLQLYYGDFNTSSATYKITAASNKWSVNGGFTKNSSDNDYKFIGKEERNTNGQYYNNTVDLAAGYKINAKNTLKFYSQVFDGERHFSLTSPNATKTKYQDFNTRNLLAWTSFLGKFVSNVKLAHITEHYRYFEDINREGFSSGGVKSYIGKYDLLYLPTSKIKINAILDYSRNSGLGSGIQKKMREVSGASLLLQYRITNRWDAEISAREEASSDYKSPLLFAAGSRMVFVKWYQLQWNISRNYRIPTFNDLYWVGSGNPDLKPESAYQAEISHQFSYKNIQMTATGFGMKIKDMIRWLPTNSGNWSPVNTDKVSVYGAEALLQWQRKINNHSFRCNGTYSYTVSLDEKSHKQLFYVPYHKMTGAASYSYKRLSAYYQLLFTGEVFTTSDNNPKYNIGDYNISNIGADYNFSKKNIWLLGFKVLNLWNEKYECLDQRTMPGRNITVYLHLNY